MDALVAFFSIASFALLIQLWSDIKEMEIDSRRNWFMMGAGLVAAMVLDAWNVYLIGLGIAIVFSVAVAKFEKKKGRVLFADGDREVIRWIIPAVSLGGLWLAAGYFVALGLCLAVQVALKKRYNLGVEMPGLIAISAAYVMVIGFM